MHENQVIMTSKCKTFEELTSNAASFLIRKLRRSQETAKHYHCLWKKVKRYMDAAKIKQFDAEVGKKYLMTQFGNRDYGELSKSEKDLVRAVGVLSEFSSHGSIQPIKEQPVFNGPVGEIMAKYIAYRISLRLSKHTIEEGEQYLYRFLCYLNRIQISSITEINQLHILKFIKTINPKFSTLTHITLESIRGFLRYAYQQNLLDHDLASIVPKDNYKKQPKLPSVYSPQEIESIIASVDRGNATGKRNYAIVLLAARLGLRASDIAHLKFENLLWERSTIVLNQFKTGKPIELPILPEIGNAIIDYLKYGRPKSDERFIFLIGQTPHRPINGGAITGIVHSYFVKSGVNIAHRKHGSHALRHSLAGVLLEKETILPVISEVLGHQDTASTSYYLRIDLKSMRKCPLEVPPVAASFYQQKGGYFYA